MRRVSRASKLLIFFKCRCLCVTIKEHLLYSILFYSCPFNDYKNTRVPRQQARQNLGSACFSSLCSEHYPWFRIPISHPWQIFNSIGTRACSVVNTVPAVIFFFAFCLRQNFATCNCFFSKIRGLEALSFCKNPLFEHAHSVDLLLLKQSLNKRLQKCQPDWDKRWNALTEL